MPFEKGRSKTGGIKKGTPRKETQLLTEMIDGALSELGGMTWLVQQGKENPVAFMSLIGKRLPRDLTIGGNINQPLVVEIVQYGGIESIDSGVIHEKRNAD